MPVCIISYLVRCKNCGINALLRLDDLCEGIYYSKKEKRFYTLKEKRTTKARGLVLLKSKNTKQINCPECGKKIKLEELREILPLDASI